jgi:oxalate decarboxylase/phosphoglucose isomerase-like protein (cupin superfamily)
VFYLLEGELDLLAFQPRSTTAGDWRTRESDTGATIQRGGPGSVVFVPAGCPHAFANPGPIPAKMIFLISPPGHRALPRGTRRPDRRILAPDQAAIRELRTRHDIHQLTPLTNRA